MLEISRNTRKTVFGFTLSIVFLVSLSLSTIFGQMSPDARILSLKSGQTIVREIKGSETHSYNVLISAGQYLNLIVEQKEIDVAIAVFDSKNKRLMRVGFNMYAQKKPKSLSFIAPSSDNYRLEVSTRGNSSGSYKIKLRKLQSVTKKGNQYVSVQQTLYEAVQLKLQRPRESIKKYEEALGFYRTKDKRIAAELYIQIGALFTVLGDNQKAIEHYNKALLLFLKFNNKQAETDIHNYIGITYSNLGENQKALESYEKALPLSRTISNKISEANTLRNMGVAYFNLGESQKALEYYNQALNISNANGGILSKASLLRYIGLVYASLGEYQKSLEYYNQALIYDKAGNDPTNEAVTIRSIGEIYSRLGETPKALENYKQSLIISRKSGHKYNEAATLNSIGTVHFNLGENQEALEYYRDALLISREAQDRRVEATALTNLGKVYSRLKENQRAVEYYNQALFLSRIVEYKRGEANTLSELQNIWTSSGNPHYAIFYGKQAVNKYQELRQSISGLDKEVQKTYLKTIEGVYRKLADILIIEGRLAEAQAVLDLLKEEEFSGVVRRNSVPEMTLPYSTAESSVLVLLNQLATLGREKGELTEKNKKDSLSDAEKQRFKEITKKIEVTEDEFNRSLAELSSEKNKGQNYEEVIKNSQAFMEDLKNLGKGTVAIYTVIINDSPTVNDKSNLVNSDVKEQIKTGWIVLVTPEYRKHYPIDVADLEQVVFAFRKALQNDTYDPKPIAQKLYKKLFQQRGKDNTTLELDLNDYFIGKIDKTLMWSLDGVLRYVPMSALHDGNVYLIEKYRNTVFNTASKARLKDSVNINWTVLGLGVSEERQESGKKFPQIKGAKRELQAIVSEHERDEGILKGTIKIDQQFTAEAMEDALLFDKNPVVHIASHFSFNPVDVDSSFLLLGKGKMTVKEMNVKSTLFTNVDLLALSACDTALGSANGKEVEGFAYVAQSLGAKAVLASLWQVADTGTDELMIRFYKLRSESPYITKGEAFRQAQLSLLGKEIKSEGSIGTSRSEVLDLGGEKVELLLYEKDAKRPFAHPHYWSSFVLIGNWR